MRLKSIAYSALALGLFFTLQSCNKDELVNASPSPKGDFTIERTGTFTAENSAPTTGSIEYGKDEDDIYFVHLTPDFTTEQATGTVGLYFSTSSTFTADPGNGNPDLMQVGTLTTNGEHYFKLNAAAASSFTHLILWCNTAQIPFGNGMLQ